MMNGWVKMPRSIIERSWFREKHGNTLRLFVFLLASAWVSDGTYEGQLIRRGSWPGTRAEMSEGTGLSLKQVDLCLRKLSMTKDIVLKAHNRFSLVIICNYNSYKFSDTIFEDERHNEGTANALPEHNQGESIPIIYKEEEKNSIISPYSPYNTERESTREMAVKIKERYNAVFQGLLPPCQRLTKSTELMVADCVERFGEQSVDLVFEQIRREPFSLGVNKTGFIANFSYIFDAKNFQHYLERAELRRQKKELDRGASAPEEPQPAADAVLAASTASVGSPEGDTADDQAQRHDQLMGMVRIVNANPRSAVRPVLMKAYESGELTAQGIEWRPN